MTRLNYTVPPAYDGARVQDFLRRDCGLSWRMVVRLKGVAGGITADGVPMRSIDRLRAGQTVVLTFPEDHVRIEGMEMPLAVVYEDAHLLMVDKPPYLAVHPSAGKPDPTLANGVVAYYEKKGEAASVPVQPSPGHYADSLGNILVWHYQQLGQSFTFRPVNRLDRNTSGLLLAAKDPHTAFLLTRKPEKVYLAVVFGRLEGEGTIDAPIRVKEGCCITREVGPGGKESVTHWQALASDGKLTLLRLRLETGRTHQIRVHMAYIGHPLVGDTMYGTDETFLPRHALHCSEMAFAHPLTGEPLHFVSPLPPDMERLLEERGLPSPPLRG